MGLLLYCFAVLLCVTGLYGQGTDGAARFDLSGPKIEIRVTRAGVTLPIATVPNLQPGDRIWLHPALPPTQSVHYLLIATFLRGTTNPPPQEWFTRVETWKKKVREEGVVIAVPADAQQAVLFLAPETGGDFATLRSAVRGRPGLFVRATQDLMQAGFEQARVEKYLAAMKLVPPSDEAALLEHSNLLARTLNLRPNQDCFKGPLDQQFNCLTQTGSQTLLNDGHGQTIVASLSSGSGSDLISAASATPLAGGGTYSAYVGAIVDFVRILNSVHTAQYQYIPAIAFPDHESLNLRLNTAPSFHNPKSVIVIGLPAIQASVLPPLRPTDPDHISCLLDPRMVLPIEGAPLVFSTSFAHDLVLHMQAGSGIAQDIPLVADAFRGGLTVAPSVAARKELPISARASESDEARDSPALGNGPVRSGQTVMGTIQGFWGFDRFIGPTVPLQQVSGEGWHIVGPVAGAPFQAGPELIAGQPNHVQITSSGTACIRSIALEGGDAPVEWKLDTAKPDDDRTPRPVDLTLNLQHTQTPGSIRLAIQQFGKQKPDQLGTKTFAEPARIESLRLYAGDLTATLTGLNLDQVRSLTLHNLNYTPMEVPIVGGREAQQDAAGALRRLILTLPPGAKPPGLKPNEGIQALVHLADGRTLQTSAVVSAPRPVVSILSKRIVEPVFSPIHLVSSDDLPLGSQLVFFLKSKAVFPRSERIEIASNDGALHMTLSVADGSLVLEDAHTVLVNFDPLKSFGASTFGAFHLRALGADGSEGQWMPLATIIRLPTLTGLHCPANPAADCVISGSGLYLIEAVSADASFTSPTNVPEGFVDPALAIPHPVAGVFYLRLRDDPNSIQQAVLPVTSEPSSGRTTPAAKPVPGVKQVPEVETSPESY